MKFFGFGKKKDAKSLDEMPPPPPPQEFSKPSFVEPHDHEDLPPMPNADMNPNQVPMQTNAQEFDLPDLPALPVPVDHDDTLDLPDFGDFEKSKSQTLAETKITTTEEPKLLAKDRIVASTKLPELPAISATEPKSKPMLSQAYITKEPVQTVVQQEAQHKADNIFFKIDQYRQLQEIMTSIRDDLDTKKQIHDSSSKILAQQDTLLQSMHHTMHTMKKNLTTIRSKLFEG